MKHIVLLLLVFCNTLLSQRLVVFDVDTTAFPVMKAKFFAFDSTGKQITNLIPSDFEITENGVPRKVLSVSCPPVQPPLALSSVLVMDASQSMTGSNILMAKEGAKAWVNALPLGRSECAITAFDVKNYLIRDFTTDRNKLNKDILFISANSGTDYNAAFINPMAGGILVAKTGKYKRVVIILSDGEPNFEPKTQEIISQAKQNSVIIYSVTLGYKCPGCLKAIAIQTGGQWFESITTEEQAREVYNKILTMAQSDDGCTIEWESVTGCIKGVNDVKVSLLKNGTYCNLSYKYPDNKVAWLEFNPPSVKFLKAVKDTCVTVKVTAHCADFNVTGVTATNPAFRMEPPDHFLLKAGESRNISICFSPVDSEYTYCRFDFDNDLCRQKLYCCGGFPGKKSSKTTIKLISPNGGEVFPAGSDTVISWEGVLPEEPVTLEYSTDNGVNWTTIAENVTGLSYKWHVPNTPSNLCLARVTAKLENTMFYYPEIVICDQVWMGKNLDEDCYRNGDLLIYAKTKEEWIDACNVQEGAWCYYGNDPKNGEIYGKLYNWWAITDPRGLAPEGWHIPDYSEWMKLQKCLGGLSLAGGKMKSTGTIEDGDGLWHRPNTGATNESGFSGLPGGVFLNIFREIGKEGYWWYYRTETSHTKEQCLFLNYNSPYLGDSYFGDVANGVSVRCVKD